MSACYNLKSLKISFPNILTQNVLIPTKPKNTPGKKYHNTLKLYISDVSEGVDAIKRNASKECDICQYKGFKFHLNVCNVFHDMSMIS